jgi:hypothetical protein
VLKSAHSSVSSHILVMRGAAAILEQASLLEELAERCGQPGAMHWLPYFLTAPALLKKMPFLVVVLRAQRRQGVLRVEDVRAAVVMFEYRVLGMPTGAFSTDDVTGFRTVIAAEEERSAVATVAANAVLEHGAQFVLVSYDYAERVAGEPRLTEGHEVEWSLRRRPVRKALPLAESYEATLAKLGKSTRFNLRYYRKRLMQRMACQFVEDARGMLGEAELDSVNAGSLNPVPADTFKRQYKSASELPGGFVVGLRAPSGRWLGLVGGWRQGSMTVLHWQMNAAGYEKDSLGTVMRAFFLEHEVGQGARTLVIYGGTEHSMQNSFVREEVTDLMVRRRSLRGGLLRAVAQMCCGLERVSGRQTNFLARVIGKEPTEWQPARRRARGKTLIPVGSEER